MFPVTTPQTAHITGNVSWSNGTAFDGYLLLGLGLPSDTNGAWPSLSIGMGKYPTLRLPLWTVVPISQGAFDQATSVFFNSSIDPPGSKYGAYWYDINWRLIYPATNVAATPFVISTNLYAITVPTLTIPTVAGSIPLPQAGNNNPISPVIPGGPLTISGTQDGVNVAFTLNGTPQYLQLFRNGQLLKLGADYSWSGTSVTMFVPPAADDILQAYAVGAIA